MDDKLAPATTLCWSCSKEYPTTKSQCPHCCVSNANTHLEWAQEEQADPSTIDHDWEHIADWEGDPGVINGTHNLYYKRCRRCGEEGEWDGQCADDYEEDYRE